MRLAIGILLFALPGVLAAAPTSFAIDIKGISLQELMQLKITSLSRKSEYASRSAASVYVLTQDEIHRMGVTHIAEALRYIPGVEVARLTANKWSVSIRGFNARTANKLLVMIDGRSIYSPLFSGVLWEEKDVLLEDVDRIEVIRGPGGTLWGANAVNGVINIITKNAKDTQGALIKAGAGLEERNFLASRYGWEMGDKTHMRVYGKSVRRDDGGGGQIADDHGEMNQAGFRGDKEFAPGHHLTLQGDLYRDQIGPEFKNIQALGQQDTGGNLLANWNLQSSETLTHNLVAYFDKTTLELRNFIDRRETLNFDYQQTLRWQRNEIVWGLGYREVEDDIETFPANLIQPRQRLDQVRSAFLQDDISVTDQWHFIVGSKYESNEYTGDQWQPSVRTAYVWGEKILWAAWSKAVRTPTRLERDISTPALPDFGVGFDAEHVTVNEVGMRFTPWTDTRVSLSAYSAEYDDLLSNEGAYLANNIEGDTQGVEVAFAYQAFQNWLLRASLSGITYDLSTKMGSVDTARAKIMEGSSPSSSVVISSLWDINPQWQLNGFIRYVDSLEALNVDAYCVADINVVWQPNDEWELQWVARHLGDSEHLEWAPVNARSERNTEVEADLALYVTWRFK